VFDVLRYLNLPEGDSMPHKPTNLLLGCAIMAALLIPACSAEWLPWAATVKCWDTLSFNRSPVGSVHFKTIVSPVRDLLRPLAPADVGE
jgi:hypothetical protein